MTRLSVFIATSVDAFIAAPDGSLAWLEGRAREDEDYGFDAFIGSVDAVAMGRGTYDHIASIDPLPYGARPVFVFTHRPPAARDGVTFWDLAPRAALDRWRDLGYGRVYVDGGRVISDFLAAGLIDDLVITTAPVVLGDGRPLFHPHARRTDLELVDVRSWPSGFVQRTYARWAGQDSNPRHEG